MKKVYIAGPMTGYEYFNFPAFDNAYEALKYSYGFADRDIFSPADHDRMLLKKSNYWMPQESDSTGPWKAWSIPGAPDLRTMLGQDLEWICKEATHIYMLKGWEKSSGARTEHTLAVALGLEIMYQ